jgi:small subunit ribosomal protein S16
MSAWHGFRVLCAWLLGSSRRRKPERLLPVPEPLLQGFIFILHISEKRVRIGNMLKIRLQRTGRKNDPHFRLIVTESTLKPKTSQFAEIVGTYNVKAGIFEAKADRVKHWMSVGAQASPTVHNLLVSKGVIEGKKINVLPKKTVQAKKEAKAA